MRIKRDIIKDWRTKEGEGQWDYSLNMVSLVKEIYITNKTYRVVAIIESYYYDCQGNCEIKRGFIHKNDFESYDYAVEYYDKKMTEKSLMKHIATKFEGLAWLHNNIINKTEENKNQMKLWEE